MAQFVLVNVVVAVLMKHLEESHKQIEEDEDFEIEMEIAKEFEAEKRALEDAAERKKRERDLNVRRPLTRVLSLPCNFKFHFCEDENHFKKAINFNFEQYFPRNANGFFKSEVNLNKDNTFQMATKNASFDPNCDCQARNTFLSPIIMINKSDSNQDICSSSEVINKTRKFSDLIDEESATFTHLMPSYPEFVQDSDQASLDSVTWTGEVGDPFSSQEDSIEKTQS